MSIVPVLLAGGAGTRLWPLSRRSFPKQFAPLTGEESPFQMALRRMSGPGWSAPLVITGADFRFVATEQMAAAGAGDGTVLIEPEGRNTAPAVLAAACWLETRDPDALMMVAPSDHSIPDTAAFAAAVETGRLRAEVGDLVTFGIAPDRPETGYGWLELDRTPEGAAAVPLRRFVEKPDAARAAEMLATGHYLWNAGLFLFSVRAILAAFERHAPEMIAPVRAAVAGARSDLNFLRLDPEAWSGLPDISIDYAVMEKAENLSVVPYRGRWSDLGDWAAMQRELPQDAAGNALSGPVTALGCQDSLIRSEDPELNVVGIGLEGMTVVAMRDAVLVAAPGRGQEVKQAVSALREAGARQAEDFTWDMRPWGRFETLARGERFQVKRIVVKPGGVLSLQSHLHRSEHWIVVSGTAKVTIGDTERLVTENESVYVPLGAKHRMENPGRLPMVLIEVQTGAYLGEDDITRYEDVYARGGGARG
ncbi:mannose-1-phosphate guanyltransferase [Oceanicola sp. 22II-s10i]|uniref:mannose-1-phosphate guanylyltransferase/mannose-6-phosphate isomerase n=1 Tax=Oceanicola sp. 22II-s10i TaxID=1317116 RepID=UPI000B528C6B|nr:mannose-1-phosphate guanylyltransferase/mannose-6-phosphate isomerase [Oceanicola sp. 22II-s10i]OWU81673.1 mannose-1-phosphate guanyltransferase [Oceanicola sp. 22II-s10i]